MKHAYLLAVLLFTLSSCGEVTTNQYEKNTSVISEGITTVSAINTEFIPITEKVIIQNSPKYLAHNEGELSELDIETAYEMCVRALTDYYKAVWNGLNINLDTFIDSNNLKQYTQQKIKSQYDVYAKNDLTSNLVQDIEIGAWEVKFTEDGNGGYLYLHIPVQINKTIGSYGEVTEFLVRNINGKLVVVDWYTGAKDSYDFIERGENLTINNPNIWNDSE
ncbi:hypothetical protein DS745_23005 [Anaerobacillus alkaliphilus]|uniref:Uncharacterized protein n=1 Tax=Anaerobacillus alkaliphilus TaxID=1548597 RepID=A0A4Q0VQD9_9BACI|nr:hypothetical protein [Anaerobacillus alkaliphilus]RXI96575.1 hypothetical protein DS745_23005 [Anaerobacillus alkaliphilus]